jgi:NAD dependent epimerase/dehydratase family enzyme
MGPNDAEIVRVYTREKSGTVADVTLDSGSDAAVVVEVEAGSTVFGLGAQYSSGLVIKDLTNGTNIPFTPASVSGTLTAAPWSNQAQSFTYTITAADLAAHKGSICQIYAYLLVGVKDFDASFVESPLFLILP